MKDSIENISKLYEKDENQRGRDIIEGIRRVREIRNRINDYKITKEHERFQYQKKFEEEKNELTTSINNWKNYLHENKLKDKMNEIQSNSNKIIEQIKKQTTKG